MLNLWLSVAALAVLAALFVAWPLLRNRERNVSLEYNREAENVVLYKSHLEELEQSFQNKDIDETVYKQLKADLDRALLEDNQESGKTRSGKSFSKPVMIISLVLMPALSLSFYLSVGEFENLELRDLMAIQEESAIEAFRAGTERDTKPTSDLIAKLEQLLENDPENLKNRYMLARNFLDIGDHRGAIGAYQEILNRRPNDPQIMAEFAQTVFFASGNQMIPEIEALIKRILDIQPENTLALSMAGIAAFEGSRFQEAIDHWTKAVGLMGNSNDAQNLRAGIANAKRLLAESGESPAEAVEPGSDDVAKVVLNVALADDVPSDPEQIVFVYARAWEGPKVPLAIARIKAQDLPTQITLDESMAMVPNMNLTSFPELELVARLSVDGSPTAKAGDWQGAVGPVNQSQFAEAFNIVISNPVN